jgi:hypothetical protein
MSPNPLMPRRLLLGLAAALCVAASAQAQTALTT